MSESRKNFYEILEIDKVANIEAVKNAYKKLALKYHPDRAALNNLTIENATELFKQLQNAYETLSEPETRKLYDECQFGNTSKKNDINIVSHGNWTKKIDVETGKYAIHTHKITYKNNDLNCKLKYLAVFLCKDNIYIDCMGPEELYNICLNKGFASPHQCKCTVGVKYSKDIKEIIRFLSILNSFQSIAEIFEDIINDISKTLGSNYLEYPQSNGISISQLKGSLVSELKEISNSQQKNKLTLLQAPSMYKIP